MFSSCTSECCDDIQPCSCIALPAESFAYFSTMDYPDREFLKTFNYLSTWMSYLDNSNCIALLNIPGTHQSMAIYPGPGTLTVPICQSWKLADQLLAGIRYIDIRVKFSDNDHSLPLYHGIVFQRGFFEDDVVKVLKQFLETHNQETVIMSLKSEGDHQNQEIPQLSSMTLEQLIIPILHKNKDLFYIHPSANCALPKLGDLRGKVWVLPYYNWELKGFSMTHLLSQRQLNHQDSFESELEHKKILISNHEQHARKDRKSRYLGQQMFINNVNAVKWHNWPSRYAKSLNFYIFKHRIFEGIIALDFPGETLIKEIVISNFDKDFFQLNQQMRENISNKPKEQSMKKNS